MSEPVNPASIPGAGRGLPIKPPEPPPSNPLEDLAMFAREVLRMHDDMQASGRRNSANNRDTETRRTFIESRPPKAFANMPGGRGKKAIPQIQPVEAGLTGGAFFAKYEDGAGDTYLQGGTVKSGSGNFTIADIKVLDFTTGVGTLSGHILVLEVTVDGYVADDVLLAGLTATAAAYVSPHATTIDDDTLPTALSHTGKKVFIEIGRWTDDDFLPSAPGHIRIAFCPGAYQITRY